MSSSSASTRSSLEDPVQDQRELSGSLVAVLNQIDILLPSRSGRLW